MICRSLTRLLHGSLALATFLFFPLPAPAEEAPLQHQATDFTFVAKKAIPAVVSIQVKATSKQKGWSFGEEGQDAMGDEFWQFFFGLPKEGGRSSPFVLGQASGFLISPEGLLLTNSHVVKEAAEIKVILNDGREYLAKLIGQDDNTDLALLKIEAQNLPYLNLGNSDDLLVGQWVVAIGNPLGLQASLTVGVVSATGRNNLDLFRIEDFIQTDAAINRGNSGGPLLNLAGDVVGINTAIVTNMSTGGYMGIGFAIPSNLAKHIVQQLQNGGTVKRGFLGVVLQKVNQDLASAFNLTRIEGALIAEVTKDSPAAKAGLEQGDIILKYNGVTVGNIATLRNVIALMTPGTPLQLTILRNGHVQEIQVMVGDYPSVVATAPAATGPLNKYGFEVQDITPEIAQKLGLTENGVIVSRVDPNSVAAWAGLKKGALIVSVNQKKVSSLEDFRAALQAGDAAKPLLLLIRQEDTTRFLSMRIQ